MAAYYVRVAHNRAAVGLFTCALRELFNLVDEVCDPYQCEVKRLPPGGFVFGGAFDLLMDHDGPDETDDTNHEFFDAGLTESWMDQVYWTEGEWSPLVGMV